MAKAEDKYSIAHAAISKNGKYILTANEQHEVKLWTSNGELLMTIHDHEATVLDLAFSDDGQYFMSHVEDGRLITCPLPAVIYEKMNQKKWN